MPKMKAGKNLLPVERGKTSPPVITIVGVGSAGTEMVSRVSELSSPDCRLVAIGTNKNKLGLASDSLIKVLIGRTLTQGVGSFGSADVGSRAVEISQDAVSKALKKSDIVFLLAGMGGGTATGALPAIAKIAKDSGALTVALVTYPHESERKRCGIAEDGIIQTLSNCDTVVVLDYNRLSHSLSGVAPADLLPVGVEVLSRTVSNWTQSLLHPVLINLDVNDFKAVFKDRGMAALAVGDSGEDADDPVDAASAKALETILLRASPAKAKSAIISITGGSNLTVDQTNAVGECLTKKIDPSAIVAWSGRADPEFDGRIEVTAVYVGVDSPYVGGRVEAEEGKVSAVGANRYAIRGKDGKIKKGLIEI